MKFPKPVPVTEIAEKIGAKLIGDRSLSATGINEIHKVQPGDITFSDVKKYFDKCLKSSASIIILNEETVCPPGKALLICKEPFEAYDQLVSEHQENVILNTEPGHGSFIHSTVLLEPNVFIGDSVTIGEGSKIRANTVIRHHVSIGKRVTIESNCVIGSDAFYFKKYPDNYKKWTTGGRVIIEDDVYIGPGCTIARGVSGDTVIGTGSKLDSQIQIGHGAVLGKRCLLAAQVGIGGKTIIEDDVVIYGQVGVAQSIRIGSGSVISAKSGISKDLEGGKSYFGIPAQEIRVIQRQLAALRHLPDLLKKMK